MWLKEFFPRDIATTHFTTKFDWPDELRNKGPSNQVNSRQGHVGSKKVRVVCESCNNQWMSQLENRAKNGLPPLIAGQACRIAPGGQRLLATWAVKTTMTAEFTTDSTKNSTQEHRSWLMSNDCPPSNWFVWIANHKSAIWANLGIYQSNVLVSPTEVDKPSDAPYYAQSTVFGVGHLLFLVIHSNAPIVNSHFHGREADGLPQIWPPQERSILWPPIRILKEKDVYELANIFETTDIFDRSSDGPNWRFKF